MRAVPVTGINEQARDSLTRRDKRIDLAFHHHNYVLKHCLFAAHDCR